MKSRARSIFGNAQVYDRAAHLLNVAGSYDPATLYQALCTQRRISFNGQICLSIFAMPTNS
jgi:hypothetical protein